LIAYYWFTWQDWGTVKEADPGTFAANERTLPFAKDKSHVFYGGNVLANADPDTFVSIPLSLFAKDKNHVYYFGGGFLYPTVVQGADPNTFVPFPAIRGDAFANATSESIYGKDDKSIYCTNSILAGADIQSFVPNGDSIGAKDKYNTYWGCAVYVPGTPP